MSSFSEKLKSTVVSKFFVALTGLALVLFLVAHLAGNLLVFSGPMAFNKYAQGLRDLGPLLWIMRGGILISFLIHIILTIRLKNLARSARQDDYVEKTHAASTIYSRSMLLSGLTILSFVLFHLAHFTWGKIQPDKFKASWILLDGRAVHDAYHMTIAGFQVSWITALYLVAVTLVFMHMQHAVQSSFQTLGFNHPRYTPLLVKASATISIVLWLGFASIPLSIMSGWVH